VQKAVDFFEENDYYRFIEVDGEQSIKDIADYIEKKTA
jgi:hypothetical protein